MLINKQDIPSLLIDNETLSPVESFPRDGSDVISLLQYTSRRPYCWKAHKPFTVACNFPFQTVNMYSQVNVQRTYCEMSSSNMNMNHIINAVNSTQTADENIQRFLIDCTQGAVYSQCGLRTVAAAEHSSIEVLWHRTILKTIYRQTEDYIETQTEKYNANNQR